MTIKTKNNSTSKKEKMVSFRVDSKTFDLISKQSKKLGLTRTQFIVNSLSIPVGSKLNKPYPFQKV